MHRHVNGADAHVYDAPDLFLFQVRQGDVIAEQEGKAGIVVLEIKAFPHPLGKLVDEAEDAVVAAASLLVHQVGFKLQTYVLVFLLAHQHRAHLRPLLHRQAQLSLQGVKLIVEHVGNSVPIDRQKLFARTQARPFGRALRVDSHNGHRHEASSSSFAHPARGKQAQGPLPQGFSSSVAVLFKITHFATKTVFQKK